MVHMPIDLYAYHIREKVLTRARYRKVFAFARARIEGNTSIPHYSRKNLKMPFYL